MLNREKIKLHLINSTALSLLFTAPLNAKRDFTIQHFATQRLCHALRSPQEAIPKIRVDTIFDKTEEKLLSKNKKNPRLRRGLPLVITTNHRFIALMLRCGKKSVSYKLFLEALFRCKDLFDKPVKGIVKDTVKTLKTFHNNQNTPDMIDLYSLKDRVTNFPVTAKTVKTPLSISPEQSKPLLPQSRGAQGDRSTKISFLGTDDAAGSGLVGMDRGASNRFRTNLLILSSCSGDAPGGFIPEKIEKGATLTISSKMRPGQDARPTQGQEFVEQKSINKASAGRIQSAIKRSRVNKRLFNRRFDLLDANNIQMKSSTHLVSERDNSTPSFVPIAFIPNVLQSKSISCTSLGLSRSHINPRINQPVDFMTHSRSLIHKVQGTNDQDKNLITLSLELRQKHSNIRVYRNTSPLKRLNIGVDSVNKVGPSVETRKVRIGGATYAVPYVPHHSRHEGIGVRWLIASASSRKQKSKHALAPCLANELMDSLNNEGQSTQKRNQSHQLAAANRAYTRYRWW